MPNYHRLPWQQGVKANAASLFELIKERNKYTPGPLASLAHKLLHPDSKHDEVGLHCEGSLQPWV